MIRLFIHEISGNIASELFWREGYDSMDAESQHGSGAKDVNLEKWIEDGKLIELDYDAIIDAIQTEDGPLVFNDNYGNGAVIINNASYEAWNDVFTAYDLDVTDFIL